METLGGFPSLPALWLRRAKPDFANADAAMRDSAFAWHPAADGRSGSSRPSEDTPGRPRAELAIADGSMRLVQGARLS
jgi:hypothetical protein